MGKQWKQSPLSSVSDVIFYSAPCAPAPPPPCCLRGPCCFLHTKLLPTSEPWSFLTSAWTTLPLGDPRADFLSSCSSWLEHQLHQALCPLRTNCLHRPLLDLLYQFFFPHSRCHYLTLYSSLYGSSIHLLSFQPWKTSSLKVRTLSYASLRLQHRHLCLAPHSVVLVAQSCPTLCDSMAWSPPGSSVS